MADTTIVLGYWAIRGHAQVARFLLEYLGLKYQDKKYSDVESWFNNDKQSLGLDFPNLPYLIDGDFKLTESEAIERYIISRAGRADELIGSTPLQFATTTMLIGITNDVRSEISKLVVNNDYENIKNERYEKTLAPKIQQLDTYLANKTFLQGEHATYPDFALYELCAIVRAMYGQQKFEPFRSLSTFQTSFETLPAIRSYLASDRFQHAPFFAPNVAKWTGL